jgi:iron(III) transport system substrate-binding protein
VAPAWPDQDGAGAHANVSGAGVVAGSDRPDEALALIEYLTTRDAQNLLAARGEFPVNDDASVPEQFADWQDVVTDPIDVEAAGPLLEDAIALMLEVGWR